MEIVMKIILGVDSELQPSTFQYLRQLGTISLYEI